MSRTVLAFLYWVFSPHFSVKEFYTCAPRVQNSFLVWARVLLGDAREPGPPSRQLGAWLAEVRVPRITHSPLQSSLQSSPLAAVELEEMPLSWDTYTEEFPHQGRGVKRNNKDTADAEDVGVGTNKRLNGGVPPLTHTHCARLRTVHVWLRVSILFL